MEIPRAKSRIPRVTVGLLTSKFSILMEGFSKEYNEADGVHSWGQVRFFG